VLAFGWVHRAAHLLDQEGVGGAAVRNQLGGLLGAMRRHRDAVGGLGPAVDHFVKVSRSYWPGLDPPQESWTAGKRCILH